MHPILASSRRRLIYLAGWLPFAVALAALLVVAGGVSTTAAPLIALPVSAFYAAVGLGSFYLCRARPLRLAEIPQVIATHVVSAALSAALAAALAGLLAHGAVLLGLDAGPQPHPAVVVFSVGLLVFLLAAALYYAFLGYEHSRAAERRALEFQLLSRDAELRALRAQIHPHFLFNALNSISALTSRDPAAARHVCLMLGDFLRSSLTLGAADLVALDEELGLAESLLSVERVRFGARLDVSLEVDPAARGCRVPPLILQPLVENAVTHGIAGCVDGGTVRVAARLRGRRLELSVDNPRDPDTPTRRGTGVGLDNVRRRLAALYGADAQLETRLGDATFHVTLSLPART